MSSHRLTIKDLTVSYQRVPALHHIDLELRCGRCIGLIGPNGAGKTTFLKALAGLAPLETGSIDFEGHGRTISDRSIAYLPQRSAVDWDFPLTVRGLVEMGRFPAVGGWGRFGREDHRIVEEALAATHLEGLAGRQISALSGGQQQRAFLARAWAQQSHIYLLDEPFTGLDRNAQAHLGELLRKLSGEEGKLVIVSHHDLKTVPELFDEVIFLNGELVAFGPVADVFTPERVAETFSTEIFTGLIAAPAPGMSGFSQWLGEPLHYEFMQRALLGCVLVGFTNGFLSAFIVLRRLALLADALSHSLLPGLAVGAIFFGLAPLGLFSGAVIAALLVGVGGQLVARTSRLKDETAIGALYTLAFSAGIILLKYARVPVDLNHFLFGNILGISNTDLWIIYFVGFLTAICLVSQQRQLLLALFEPSVAQSVGVKVAWLNYLLITLMILAMIASLQAVGVVLSIGLLVLPAATIYLLSDSYSLLMWGGGVLGAVGASFGLLLSYWTDIPSGPAIVLSLGVGFVLALVFGPRYGVLARFLRPRHMHGESLARWEKAASDPT